MPNISIVVEELMASLAFSVNAGRRVIHGQVNLNMTCIRLVGLLYNKLTSFFLFSPLDNVFLSNYQHIA